MLEYKSTILITGGTTGLGYYTALELAKQVPTAKIIICSRSDQNDSVASLNKLIIKSRSSTISTPQVEYLRLDLGSAVDVRSFVKTYASRNYPPISKLLLNAGLQYHNGKDLRMSPDGIESTFAINHFGHALLLFLLKPYLANTARIAVTASGTHDPAQKTTVPDAEYISAELLANPTDGQGYDKSKGLQRYASSKLANVLFTYALEKRLKNARSMTDKSASTEARSWTVVAFDPGLMPGTALGRDMGPVIMFLATHIIPHMMTLFKLLIGYQNVHLPQESGKRLAKLALMAGAEAEQTSGKYFEGEKMIGTSEVSYVAEKQEDLWRWTIEKAASGDEGEMRQFERF